MPENLSEPVSLVTAVNTKNRQYGLSNIPSGKQRNEGADVRYMSTDIKARQCKGCRDPVVEHTEGF